MLEPPLLWGHSNADSSPETSVHSGLVTTATIPHIRGIPETIARILQPYNIRVAHKPITTLPRLLTNVKDKDKPKDSQGTVYKIKCCDWQATYVSEAGRNLSPRLTEHKRATRDGDVNNHSANRLGLCDMYYVFYRQLACEGIRFFGFSFTRRENPSSKASREKISVTPAVSDQSQFTFHIRSSNVRVFDWISRKRVERYDGRCSEERMGSCRIWKTQQASRRSLATCCWIKEGCFRQFSN